LDRASWILCCIILDKTITLDNINRLATYFSCFVTSLPHFIRTGTGSFLCSFCNFFSFLWFFCFISLFLSLVSFVFSLIYSFSVFFSNSNLIILSQFIYDLFCFFNLFIGFIRYLLGFFSIHLFFYIWIFNFIINFFRFINWFIFSFRCCFLDLFLSIFESTMAILFEINTIIRCSYSDQISNCVLGFAAFNNIPTNQASLWQSNNIKLLLAKDIMVFYLLASVFTLFL